jgi:hypothetical protein
LDLYVIIDIIEASRARRDDRPRRQLTSSPTSVSPKATADLT